MPPSIQGVAHPEGILEAPSPPGINVGEEVAMIYNHFKHNGVGVVAVYILPPFPRGIEDKDVGPVKYPNTGREPKGTKPHHHYHDDPLSKDVWMSKQTSRMAWTEVYFSNAKKWATYLELAGIASQDSYGHKFLRGEGQAHHGVLALHIQSQLSH